MSSLAKSNPGYAPIPRSLDGYKSFRDFYPYYLGEHHEPTNRTLHIIGTTCSVGLQSRGFLGLIPVIVSTVARQAGVVVSNPRVRQFFDRIHLSLADAGWYFGASILTGYAFAWVGHFFFEQNKPATFKHPFYSLRGDYTMWFHILTGQRALYPAGKQELRQ